MILIVIGWSLVIVIHSRTGLQEHMLAVTVIYDMLGTSHKGWHVYLKLINIPILPVLQARFTPVGKWR